MSRIEIWPDDRFWLHPSGEVRDAHGSHIGEARRMKAEDSEAFDDPGGWGCEDVFRRG